MARPKKQKANKGVGGKRAKGNEKSENGKIDTTELSIRNSQLWESRVALAESQQKAFRKKNNDLTEQIYGLQDLVHNSEKDIVSVIAHLMEIDKTKSVKIGELQAEIRTMGNTYERERDEHESRLNDRIKQLSCELTEKEEIVRNQWLKLEEIRIFTEERQHMEAEILRFRLELRTQKLCYDEKVKLLELKCYSDKKKMEAGFEESVKEVTIRATQQAREHLMKAAQTALKQNIDLRHDLELQTERASILSTQLTESEDKNRKLQFITEELEASAFEHQRKFNSLTEDNAKLRTEAKELRELAECFKTQASEPSTVVQLQSPQRGPQDTAHLERIFEEVRLEKLRAARIKALGEKILQERTLIETFLLSALREYHEEINQTRIKKTEGGVWHRRQARLEPPRLTQIYQSGSAAKDYTKIAETAFRHQMVLTNNAKSSHRRLRNFQRDLPNSNNSVSKDFDAAEQRTLTTEKQVYLSDLTLEQKEQVLRRLFEKINASRVRPPKPSLEVSQEDNPGDCPVSVPLVLPALVSSLPNERSADAEDDSTAVTTKLSSDSPSPAKVPVQPSAGQLITDRPHTSSEKEPQRGTEDGSRAFGSAPAPGKIQGKLTFETEQVEPQITNDGLIAIEAEDNQTIKPDGLQAQLPEELKVQLLVVEENGTDRLSASTTDLHDGSTAGLNTVGLPSAGAMEGSHQEDNEIEDMKGGIIHEQNDETPESSKQAEPAETYEDASRDSKVITQNKVNKSLEMMYHSELGSNKDVSTLPDIKHSETDVKKPSIKTEENGIIKPTEQKTSEKLAKEDENVKRPESKSKFADTSKENELESEDRVDIGDIKDVKQVGEKMKKESRE